MSGEIDKETLEGGFVFLQQRSKGFKDGKCRLRRQDAASALDELAGCPAVDQTVKHLRKREPQLTGVHRAALAG